MAALKFLQGIDLNGNELVNSVFQNLGAAPSTYVKAGRVYFNTADKKFYFHNGSEWVSFADASYFTDGKANNADKLDGVSLEDLFTSLSSSATNAVSVTVGGVTKNISTSAMKTSLGLGSLAYKSTLSSSDIPNLDWSKITTGKPSTLSGYGITDAYTKAEINNVVKDYLPLTGGTITGHVYFGDQGGWGIWLDTTTQRCNIFASGFFVENIDEERFASIDGKGNAAFEGTLRVGGTATFDNSMTSSGTIIANGDVLLGYVSSASQGSKYKALYAKSSGGTNKNVLQLLNDDVLSLGSGVGTVKVNTLSATKIVIGDAALVWDASYKALRLEDASSPDEVAATFYATGGVSALGEGLDGGGTGGLIQSVYGYSDLAKAGFDDANLNDTFNAYTIKSIYDLAQLTSVSLSGVSSNVTRLNTRVGALEKYFDTAEDSDNLINKWNEITDFLEGFNEGDELTALLAGKVDKVSVGGTGNAVTSASISGSTLTLTKGSTFLTSHQNIYNLDIKTLVGSATTTVTTFDPNSAANSITFVQGSGITLTPDATNKRITISATYSYTLPLATSSARGGIKIGYTASGSNIPVLLSNEQAYVSLTSSAVTSALGFTPYTKVEVDSLLAKTEHVVKRYNSDVTGNGSTTSFTVTHNLNTKDVIVFVYESASPNQQVFVDIEMTSTTAIKVVFASAPASGVKYRVVILA